MEPGHQRRQRAISIWRRSGDHALQCKYKAVVMFLLIGRIEGPKCQNFIAYESTSMCMRVLSCLIPPALRETNHCSSTAP